MSKLIYEEDKNILKGRLSLWDSKENKYGYRRLMKVEHGLNSNSIKRINLRKDIRSIKHFIYILAMFIKNKLFIGYSVLWFYS